jgi:hypothetical protein
MQFSSRLTVEKGHGKKTKSTNPVGTLYRRPMSSPIPTHYHTYVIPRMHTRAAAVRLPRSFVAGFVQKIEYKLEIASPNSPGWPFLFAEFVLNLCKSFSDIGGWKFWAYRSQSRTVAIMAPKFVEFPGAYTNNNVWYKWYRRRRSRPGDDRKLDALFIPWLLSSTSFAHLHPQSRPPRRSNPYQPVGDFLSNVGRFKIIESTLREGEQFANAYFDTETKIKMYVVRFE